jgi:PadR family transcriptional regulator PadR
VPEAGKADLALLVLAVLGRGPMHGYAIARQVEKRSRGVLQAREGALYPVLRVLETDGLVAGQWETPTSGPARRVYSLTAAGRTALGKRTRAWKAYIGAVQSVLGGRPSEQAT